MANNNVAPQHYRKPANAVRNFRYDFLGGLDIDVAETLVSIVSINVTPPDFSQVIPLGIPTEFRIVGPRTCPPGQVAEFQIGTGGVPGQVYDIEIIAQTSEGQQIPGHAIITAE